MPTRKREPVLHVYIKYRDGEPELWGPDGRGGLVYDGPHTERRRLRLSGVESHFVDEEGIERIGEERPEHFELSLGERIRFLVPPHLATDRLLGIRFLLVADRGR